MKWWTLAITLLYATAARADVFTADSQQLILSVVPGEQANLEIESIETNGSTEFVIHVMNHEDVPVTANGIVVFFDKTTGHAIMAVGGRDNVTGQIQQAPPGRSSQVNRCFNAGEAPGKRDFNHGSYHCMFDNPRTLTDAGSAMFILLEAVIDDGDRD